MKATIDPKVFADAVGAAARQLPTRPSVPITAGLLLLVKGGKLTVTGYDYDVSTQAVLDLIARTDEQDGTALVSGRLLADITKALPAKPVELALVGSHLEMVCGSSRFTLPTMPVEDYPAIPSAPNPAGTIEASAFGRLIAQVAVAAGRDNALPMMTGVRIELTSNTIAMLATDRYRVAIAEMEWTPAGELAADPVTALVPAKVLADLGKGFGAAGGNVTLSLDQTTTGQGVIGLAGARQQITARLLDGANYPPVRSLFPTAFAAHAQVPVGALIEVVQRVALVAESTAPVLLTFNEQGLIVEAGGTGSARGSEAMDATFTGQPLTIGFNPKYLVEGLHGLGHPVAHIGFVDERRPALLTGAPAAGHPVDLSYRYLIMPIRVR